MPAARVVLWLANGAGKGFALKAVIAVGAIAGAAIAGVSYKIGQAIERKRKKREETIRESEKHT